MQTHTNPIFHRSASDADLLNVISKDDEKVVLQCEDKFGLLSDKYWFEIKQKIDFNTEVADDSSRINCLRVRNVDEVNQSCNNDSEVNDENRISNGIKVRNVDEVNQSCSTTTPVKRRLPDWMKSPSTDSRKKRKDGPMTHDTSINRDIGENSNNTSIEIPIQTQSSDNGLSEDAIESSSHAIIPSNDIEMPSSPIQSVIQPTDEDATATDSIVDQPASTSCASPDNTTTEIKTEIKDEPNCDNGNGNTSTSIKKDSPQKLNIKKDPDPVPVNLRTSCSFGIKCYRFEFSYSIKFNKKYLIF